MAAHYWHSTQCHRWLVTHAEVEAAREEDRLYADVKELAALTAWCVDGTLRV